jgi:replicative DNA helicase
MSDTLFNQESEVAVLSILLKNPEKVFDLGGIRNFMFSSSPNKLLFSSIEDLRSQNLVPEFSLVTGNLQSKDILKDCGGTDYLNYLMNQTFDSGNLKEFERIVINSYKARTLLSLSADMKSLVSNSDQIDGVISQLRNSLDNLSETNGGSVTEKLSDLIQSTWQVIVDKVKNPHIDISTGYDSVDAVTGGYWPGDLWVIAGRPGSGKSALLCNTVLRSAKKGIGQLIFSLEMSKHSLIQRMLAIETGVPVTDIRLGLLNQKQLDLISDKIKEIKDLPIFIDTNYNNNPNYLSSTIRRYKKLYDIKVTHLDYIQLLVPRDTDATHAIGAVSRELKLLANDLGIINVMYSQLNRLVELRDDKRPILSDLRQSGNLEEDPDMVVFLYRDVMYSPDTRNKNSLEYIIRKQRNGPIGTINMNFSVETNYAWDSK